MNRNWNVGIAGLSRGRGFVNVLAAHPRVKVNALCDLDETRLADLGKAFDLDDSALTTDYDRMLEKDVDIVIIATPIRFHADQTVAALEAGKHVLCEQTAAYTVDDCERIVETVKRTGKTYMMAENYCYFHFVREWKQLVDAGKIGDIYYAEAEYIHDIEHLMYSGEKDEWFWRHERPPIWYCAHCLGPIVHLTGDRVVKASGVSAGFHKRPEFKDHPGFQDMQVALFQTEGGRVFKILRSQVAPRYPHMVYYSFYGTKGYIENGRKGGLESDGFTWIDDGTPHAPGRHPAATPTHCPMVDPNAPEEAKTGGHGTSEYYMIREFLDAIEAGARPPIDVIRSMDMTVPGIVANESSLAGGEWRDVPLFHW